MTPKENFLAAVRFRNPGRVPVALLSGGVWAFGRAELTLAEGLGKGSLIAEVIAEGNKSAGSDAVWVGSGFNNLPVRVFGGELKFRERGAPDVKSPALKSASGIPSLDPRRILDDSGITGFFDAASILKRQIGSKTLIYTSGWGPFTLAAQLYGVERFLREIYRDPGAVHEVLSFAEEVAYINASEVLRAGADVAYFGEPTASGDLISRPHFEKFAIPYIKNIAGRLKNDLGAPTHLHICGDITDRLDLLPGTGIELISVDYKVDIATAYGILGRRIALGGNVNPVSILQNGTKKEVRDVSLRCIEAAGPSPSGGFVLMPGCDIPHRVPLANAQAFVKTAKEWIF